MNSALSTRSMIAYKKNAIRLSHSRYEQYAFKLANLEKNNFILLQHMRSVSTETHRNSGSQSRTISITLPDLTPKESLYVQNQVNAILHPNFFKSFEDVLEIKESRDNTNAKNSSVNPDLNNPDTLKKLFPPNTKNASSESVEICKRILTKEFPSFYYPESLSQQFRLKFRYPLVAERTVAALSSWGVTNDDIKKDPSLVTDSFPELVKYGKASELFEVPILEAKALYLKNKYQPSLRGLLIRKKIAMLEKSLNNLGFKEISDNLSKHAAIELSKLNHATIDDIDEMCDKLIIKELIDKAEFSDKDINTMFKQNVTDGLPILIGAADAQAVARNYFLFKNVMKMKNTNASKLNEKNLVKSCFKSCPAETLILLNTYWNIINSTEKTFKTKSDDNHAVENSDFIAKLAESKGFKKLINFPTYGFPVSLKKIYFTNMGFNSDEIDHLILSEESFEFKSTDSEGRPLHYTQSHYLSTMTKRLSILRENGTKMGLLTPSDYFKAMKNWRGLVTCIGDKAKEHDCSNVEQIKGEKSKHNAASAAMIGDAVRDFLKTSDRGSVKNILNYLQDYFGTGECQKELTRDIFEKPQYARFAISGMNSKNINNLKSYQVCQTLHWLENQGFEKSQIRKALPLLFYHPAILEQKIVEIKEMEEFQPWAEQPEAHNGQNNEENRILEVLLYLVEKEFSFSDEGTYFAQENKAVSLNQYFSESLCNEVTIHTGVKLLPEKSTKINKETDSFLQELNEDMPELKHGNMNFQDFIYLYDPSEKNPTKKDSSNGADILISNSITRGGGSAILKNENLMKTANRQFCSFSHQKKLNNKNTMNMSSETPKKKQFYKRPWLMHIPNPFNWIDMKVQYLGLQNSVDPKFKEDEFIRGSKQAVSTVTSLIASNEYDDMKGLLSERELSKIKRDIETKWPDQWRNNIELSVDEIEWVGTNRINRYQVGKNYYVDITLQMKAVKEIPSENKNIHVLIDITAEFSKVYSENSFGDWYIIRFVIDNMEELN